MTNTEKDLELNEETDKSAFNARAFLWITIGLVIGILTSYCIFNITLKSAIQQLDSTNSSSLIIDTDNINEGISTYTESSSIISDETKIAEAKAKMNEYVNGITKGSTYSQVMIGEDEYIYYMYNSKGEIFTQSDTGSYTEVFLNNNNVLKFDTEENTLSIGKDTDIATVLKNSISAIDSDKVTLYEMDLTELNITNANEYRIDLVGEEAVKLLYTSAGNEFAQEMVDSIKASIPDWEPHVIISMYISDNKEESYCCCLYVIDGAEYTNWLFQGYDTISDWELSEDWYTYDADKDTEGEIYLELISGLIKDVDTVMLEYANSKGWLESEENIETE